MIRYELTLKDDLLGTVATAIVSLNSDNPDKTAPIVVEGDDQAVAAIWDVLPHCSGMFGHGVGRSTSPIDLNAAMLYRGYGMAAFTPRLIEGAEILEGWTHNIPDGAVS